MIILIKIIMGCILIFGDNHDMIRFDYGNFCGIELWYRSKGGCVIH